MPTPVQRWWRLPWPCSGRRGLHWLLLVYFENNCLSPVAGEMVMLPSADLVKGQHTLALTPKHGPRLSEATFSFTAPWTSCVHARAGSHDPGFWGQWLSVNEPRVSFPCIRDFSCRSETQLSPEDCVLFTASHTASLAPPHPLPDSTKLERERKPACVGSALGQLAGFVSACEACTALALGSPLGVGESRGHLSSGRSSARSPGRVPGVADACPECVTLNLQHGRTIAQLALHPHWPARQASPAVPRLPFRVPGWRRWKGQELGQTGSS